MIRTVRSFRLVAVPLAATLAATLTTGSVPASAAPATAAQAGARVEAQDFGHVASAWGSRVVSQDSGYKSGRTAYSVIACTTRSGVDKDQPVRAVDLPAENGGLNQVSSSASTFARPARGIHGVRTTARVGHVELLGVPQADGLLPTLTIDALETVATVAHRQGRPRFRSSVDFSSGRVSLSGIETPPTGTPLDDLLGGVEDGIGGVLDALEQNGGSISVPDLGVVSQARTHTVGRRGRGVADGMVLRVTMVDGTEVQIGRAISKMFRRIPAGPMSGEAAAVRILGDKGGPLALSGGTLVKRPLPCTGTQGRVRSTPERSHQPGDLGDVGFGSAKSSVYGVQKNSGAGTAWTRVHLEDVVIGGAQGLRITEVTARALARQRPSGRVLKRTTGTSLGTLYFGGEKQGSLEPGETWESQDGRFRVRAGAVQRTHRAITVVGARVTVTDDLGRESVVLLGRTRTAIKRR